MRSVPFIVVLSAVFVLLAQPFCAPGAGAAPVSLEEEDEFDDVQFLIPETQQKTSVSGHNSVDILRASVTSSGDQTNFSVTLAGPVRTEAQYRYTFHINATEENKNHTGYQLWYNEGEAWLYDWDRAQEIQLSFKTYALNTNYDNSLAIYLFSDVLRDVEGWTNIEVETHEHEMVEGNISTSFSYDKLFITPDSPPAQDNGGGTDGTDGEDGEDGEDGTDGTDGEDGTDGTDGTGSDGDGINGDGETSAGDDGEGGETDSLMMVMIVVMVLVFILLLVFMLSQKMKIDREMEEMARLREERRSGGKGKGRDRGKGGDREGSRRSGGSQERRSGKRDRASGKEGKGRGKEKDGPVDDKGSD